MNNKRKYFHGLNEIRALAALGVVFGHMNIGPKLLASNMVIVFFTLSGFLISYLLLEEKKLNSIHIGNFYIRRILRIFPLYYFYIALVILIYGWSKEIWLYIFFAGNFALSIDQYIYNLSHYWSLGVEEQFYLLWPWLLKYTKSFIRAMLSVLLIYFIIKFATILSCEENNPFFKLVFLSTFQSMAIGGIGAYLWYTKQNITKWIINPYVELATYGITILIYSYANVVPAIIRTEILSLLVIVIILQQISGKAFLKFSNKILNYIGIISFGIYIYHPLIMNELIKFGFMKTNFFVYVMSVISLTILVSILSYKYLEKPFLRFKNKFTDLKSKTHPPTTGASF